MIIVIDEHDKFGPLSIFIDDNDQQQARQI
jgi:hypothetical protein